MPHQPKTHRPFSLPSRLMRGLKYAYLGHPETPGGMIVSGAVASLAGGYQPQYVLQESMSITGKQGYTVAYVMVTSAAGAQNIFYARSPLQGTEGVHLWCRSMELYLSVGASGSATTALALTVSNSAGTNDIRNRPHWFIAVQKATLPIYTVITVDCLTTINCFGGAVMWSTQNTPVVGGTTGVEPFSGTIKGLFLFDYPMTNTLDLYALHRTLVGLYAAPETL